VRIAIELSSHAARLPRIARSQPAWPARPQALVGHPAADIVGGEQPLEYSAVARCFLRRNLERLRAQASARARPDDESAGALRERTKPPALPIEHLDLADMAVSVRIKLDPRLARATAFRHVDHAGRTANTERGARRGDFHVAGLGDQARDEGSRADHELERGGVGAAAFLIDEFIDDDARVRGKAEGCLVVECDAERRTRAGRERVVLKNAVADLQGNSGRGSPRVTVALPCKVAT
jgi:hypothetical protein